MSYYFLFFYNTRDKCISYVNYILGFKIDINLIYNYLIYSFHLTNNIWHLIFLLTYLLDFKKKVFLKYVSHLLLLLANQIQSIYFISPLGRHFILTIFTCLIWMSQYLIDTLHPKYNVFLSHFLIIGGSNLRTFQA